MANKLFFRPRNLDNSKPLCIYRAQDLPEVLLEAHGINRSVPALPTGMEKEEEAEKHLQDILMAQLSGLIGEVSTMTIPVPEFHSSETIHQSLYSEGFKTPRQYIHVQPFGPNQDLPDYDLDDDDVKFLKEELRGKRDLDVSETVLEEMIDRLEKNSSHSVLTLNEAKSLLHQDDDLILLVYDYWLNKRWECQHGLIPALKTSSSGPPGTKPNPYVCFRRRTEKMQTRKNRKNDELSYELMLKLRRDLNRAVTLLELVKKREKTKKEKLNLTLDVFDKRFHMKDFDGKLIEQICSSRPKSSQSGNLVSWTSLGSPTPRKTYKKRKNQPRPLVVADSEEDTGEEPEEGPFTFRRREGVHYLAPLEDMANNNVKPSWERSHPFTLTHLPGATCLFYCRRRLGRGGRVVLDRSFCDSLRGVDSRWGVRPRTPPHAKEEDWDPYKTRVLEVDLPMLSQVSLVTHNKVRILDKVGAHNAARALVDSQFVDIFATTPPSSSEEVQQI